MKLTSLLQLVDNLHQASKMDNLQQVCALQTSQGKILHTLQHFATKLYNFTNFLVFFLDVVIDSLFFAQIKV